MDQLKQKQNSEIKKWVFVDFSDALPYLALLFLFFKSVSRIFG